MNSSDITIILITALPLLVDSLTIRACGYRRSASSAVLTTVVTLAVSSILVHTLGGRTATVAVLLWVVFLLRDFHRRRAVYAAAYAIGETRGTHVRLWGRR